MLRRKAMWDPACLGGIRFNRRDRDVYHLPARSDQERQKQDRWVHFFFLLYVPRDVKEKVGAASAMDCTNVVDISN